jgi:hypothetical protein
MFGEGGGIKELLFSGHRRFLVLLFVSKCEPTEMQGSDGLGKETKLFIPERLCIGYEIYYIASPQ